MITPEQAEIIKKAIESDRIDLHVGLPGKVQKVYPAVAGVRDWGADIVLEVKRTLPKNEKEYVTEDLPVLSNVPVAFQGSNDFFLAFALKPGDQGRVMFMEQSIDQWRTKGTNTSPGDVGRHTLTGGVFVPDLKSVLNAFSDALTSGFALGKKGGCQLRSPAGATMEVTTAGAPASVGGFVALATLVLAELNKIKTAFDAHTHLQALPLHPAVPPTGPTGAPIVPMPAPAAPASTNLKAD